MSALLEGLLIQFRAGVIRSGKRTTPCLSDSIEPVNHDAEY